MAEKRVQYCVKCEAEVPWRSEADWKYAVPLCDRHTRETDEFVEELRAENAGRPKFDNGMTEQEVEDYFAKAAR